MFNSTRKEDQMTATDSTAERWAAGMGTANIMAWFLFLGPVGLAMLYGVAYAMVTQNLALGVVCGLLVFTPLVMGVVWGSVQLYAHLRKAWAKQEASSGAAVAETAHVD
jgi:hypothetical protein